MCHQVFVVLFSWDSKNRTWELTDTLRPAIVNLDWQKGGKTVFKSINYAGYIGVLTAMKPVRCRCVWLY